MKYYLDNLFARDRASFRRCSQGLLPGLSEKWGKWIQKENMGPGDRLICYCTRIQRFIGAFELASGPVDNTLAKSSDENDFTRSNSR